MGTKKKYGVCDNIGYFSDFSEIYSEHATKEAAERQCRRDEYIDEGGQLRRPTCVVLLLGERVGDYLTQAQVADHDR